MSTRDSDRPSQPDRESIPPKPTRDAAARDSSRTTHRGDALDGDPAPTDSRDQGIVREKIQPEAHAPRNPPHVSTTDAEAEIQHELPSPGEVPVPSANASGIDKLTPDEQHVDIDPESMYNGRPERSKDWKPTDRPDPPPSD